MADKKRSFLIAILVTVAGVAATASVAANVPVDAQEGPFVKDAVLAERDFPLLAAMSRDTEVIHSLAKDALLARVADQRWKAAATVNASCHDGLHCATEALKWTPEQITEVTEALRRMYNTNSVLRRFVGANLAPHEVFTRDSTAKEEDIFLNDWKSSAEAMNTIIATYGEGVLPRYREIDAMTYDAGSRTYEGLIRIILDQLPWEADDPSAQKGEARLLFFEPSLRFSIRLLQANSRDEAGRYWPLDSGENALAIQRSRTIDWSRYRYSVIVIPGAGSEVAGVALSPWGKERLRAGMEAYRSGLAPFLLVTGGFVHPAQTPYCEAMEMKRYLQEVYGIPASAILVEPYARHTTTNLRNAARQIFQYRLPSSRPLAIVSDKAQIDYIASEMFRRRCNDELGYVPVNFGKRLSPNDLEALPVKESLFRDPADPLDP